MKRLSGLGMVLFAACGAMQGPMTEGPATPPAPKQRLADLEGEPSSVMPLVTLGDVNEDGAVNDDDLQLVCDLAKGLAPAAASCPAAADLDLDGQLTEGDHERMRALVAGGPVKGPSLYAQPTLPCAYSNLKFGATAVFPGERTRIRLFRGLTVENVEAQAMGPVELVPAQDGKGFDVFGADQLPPGSSVSISLKSGDLLRFYTLTRPANDDDTLEDFGQAPPSDGGTPPSSFDSADAGDACPFEQLGCQVLIIDFSKTVWFEYDADRTKDAFTASGCNVTYSAPTFQPMPQATTVSDDTLTGSHQVPPDATAVATVKAHNRAEWAKVKSAIATHRAALSNGANLAVQLLNGHGGAFRCGSVGPEFYTGVGWLGRAAFHEGNYAAESHRVCHAAAMDWTCSGGLSVKAVKSLDNTGAAGTCQMEPPISHPLHAGYYSDMAMSIASASAACTNGSVGDEDSSLSSMIETEGQTKDYNRLAAGIRDRLPGHADTSPYDGYYSDRGYNLRPTTRCEDGAHVSGY